MLREGVNRKHASQKQVHPVGPVSGGEQVLRLGANRAEGDSDEREQDEATRKHFEAGKHEAGCAGLPADSHDTSAEQHEGAEDIWQLLAEDGALASTREKRNHGVGHEGGMVPPGPEPTTASDDVFGMRYKSTVRACWWGRDREGHVPGLVASGLP